MRFNRGNSPFTSLSLYIEEATPVGGSATATAVQAMYKGSKIVIKIFPRSIEGFENRYISTEISTYQRLVSVEGILDFYGCVILAKGGVGLLIENGGKPLKELSSYAFGNYSERLGFFKEIAAILGRISEKGLVLLDLSLASIVYEPSKKVLRLSDFGFMYQQNSNLDIPDSIFFYFSLEKEKQRKCDISISLWKFFFSVVIGHYCMLDKEILQESFCLLGVNSSSLPALKRFSSSIIHNLPDRNPRFLAFIRKGLDPHEANRYQNFGEIIAELDELQKVERNRLKRRSNRSSTKD